jgi:hypothetical protein
MPVRAEGEPQEVRHETDVLMAYATKHGSTQQVAEAGPRTRSRSASRSSSAVSGVVPSRVRFSVVPFAVAIVAGGPAGCLERADHAERPCGVR